MNKKILIIITMMILGLAITSNNVSGANNLTPEQVVAEFQKLPHEELFCQDKSWIGDESIRVSEKFKKYFSNKFFSLYMWAECYKPSTPPHYSEMDNYFDFDIRYSMPGSDIRLENVFLAKNIQVKKIKNNLANKAFIEVKYSYQTTGTTNYTLIREDGQWKIDDIAPRSNYVKGSGEEYYGISDSIKADMQKNYNAAMERYNKEQAKKGMR
jgi:hypothetical protein